MNILINHINSLYPYALILTKNKMDAEDLIQDLHLQVLRRMDYFNDKNIKVLYSTMRHIHYHNILKRWDLGRDEKKPVVCDIDLHRNAKIIENDAWGRIQKRELQDALVKLNKYPKAQICFRLRIEGYRTNEIVELTGNSTDVVKKGIGKAKNFLKKQLAA